MFDNIIDRHKNPMNAILHMIGIVTGIYGLWMHDWNTLLISLVILIMGHFFPIPEKSDNKGKKK